ncbi:MAG: flavin-containing monooxygenase, partial [Bacteroidia bacterium]
MPHTPILIIGAGPAGLAVAGRLREKGLEFVLLEKTDQIASSWHNHYDRLCLHTVKELSHLPHLPFPEDFPLYVPRLDLIRYYEHYVAHFDIKPRFNQSVSEVKKSGDKWEVLIKDGEHWTSDHVVIATGVNHIPNRPEWSGEASFAGQILHSHFYKNPQPFLHQKVLVVGMGNTGAEIALDLAEHDVDVSISVRTPVNIVPRDLFGKPVQTSGKLLEKLPRALGDWIGAQVRKVVFGDLTKYGLPISKVPPAVQVRQTGKTPVIDLGTIDYIKQGKINVVGDISSFQPEGVKLSSGDDLHVDAVILATGYRPRLADFIQNIDLELDSQGLPKSSIPANEAFAGMYFVGFDNYSLGGLLGTIYDESERVVEA